MTSSPFTMLGIFLGICIVLKLYGRLDGTRYAASKLIVLAVVALSTLLLSPVGGLWFVLKGTAFAVLISSLLLAWFCWADAND